MIQFSYNANVTQLLKFITLIHKNYFLMYNHLYACMKFPMTAPSHSRDRRPTYKLLLLKEIQKIRIMNGLVQSTRNFHMFQSEINK